MPRASCGLNALAFAASELDMSSAVTLQCSSIDSCVGLTASVEDASSTFYSGSNPSDGYATDGISTCDEAELSSHPEALGPLKNIVNIHTKDETKSMKRRRQHATIVGYDQEAWSVKQSDRIKRVAPNPCPNQATQVGKESFEKGFAHGFSEGFLAGCKYIESHVKDCHSQILDNSSAEGPKARGSLSSRPSRGGLSRRPYRFCSKCWIMHKQWVLKSIKLPTGSVVSLHPEICPDWDKPDEEPTKGQLRLYGAAFKRAQRSLLLHDVALNTYKSVMPGVPERALQDFLHGRQ